ncbi:MAG: 2Fe-2S iron-sulfur cluster-binding protein [Methylococcaceae bacterium]
MRLSTDNYNSKQANWNPERSIVAPLPAQQFWVNNLLDTADEPYTPDKIIVTRNMQVITEMEIHNKLTDIMLGSHLLADLQLSWPNVAPFHAKIFYQDGCYYLEDMGSEQGIYLNGKKMPLYSAKPVESDTIARIMAFTITFSCEKKRSVLNNEQTSAGSSDVPSYITNTIPDASASDLLLNIELNKPVGLWSDGAANLTVVRIINETSQVKTFQLLAETPTAFIYKPGQYVTVMVTINGEEHSRCYSMSSSPSRPYRLDLTVKREPGGLVSNWLCDQIKQGDRLTLKKPKGRFSCLSSPASKLLFVGAGSGITPLMSMVRWLADTNSSVTAKFLVSFREFDDIIFRSELELMSASECNVDIGVTLTSNKKLKKPWQVFRGRVDKTMLYEFAPDVLERDIYLCGPEGFMTSIKATLQEIGYPMHRLHCESFNPKPSLCEAAKESSKNPLNHNLPVITGHQKISKLTDVTTEHSITFLRSKKTVTIDEHTNLLQAAESQGVSIDYDCRSGSCGACMVKCITGDVAMNDECDIDDIERQQGWVFSCCAFAKSDVDLDL